MIIMMNEVKNMRMKLFFQVEQLELKAVPNYCKVAGLMKLEHKL